LASAVTRSCRKRQKFLRELELPLDLDEAGIHALI
jgi:hypothetical protein